MSSNQIMDKFQKIPLGEKIILVAGPLLLIDSFLPWYHVSIDLGILSTSVNRSGWQSPGALWSMLAIICGVVAAGLVAASRFTNVQMPALPAGVTWARVYAGLGGAAALFVILKLINHSGNLGFGFFIGIILVAALCAGGGLLFQAERAGTTGGSSTM